MKAAADNYMIKTVARAMDLLDQFREGDTEFGITDLSNRLKLQKNNVFRLVATLSAKKYIEVNDSTGKYRLGLKARALGQMAKEQVDFVNHARPFLNKLKQQSHETCYFSVMKDGASCYIDGVESDLPVRVVQLVGKSRPLHCTAAGKVLLAFQNLHKRSDLLAGLEIGENSAGTVVDPGTLSNELKLVAQQGYAIDQEYEQGVMEIAAPVFDATGAIIGALGISGPTMRIAARLECEMLPLVCLNAARLSALLGYSRSKDAPGEKNLLAVTAEKSNRKLDMQPFGYSGLETCCR